MHLCVLWIWEFRFDEGRSGMIALQLAADKLALNMARYDLTLSRVPFREVAYLWEKTN